MTAFIPFPKIPRLSREMIITEKLDGTNAQILIDDIEEIGMEGFEKIYGAPILYTYTPDSKKVAIRAASRNRVLTPDHDNYGFGQWVLSNFTELVKLGVGHHAGEWWGKGIQRGYGLNEKRFSLFNTNRWNEDNPPPACCDVVPVIYQGAFDTYMADVSLALLKEEGSKAAPGYRNPEGIIVFHTAANSMFKKTFEHDEKGKEAA